MKSPSRAVHGNHDLDSDKDDKSSARKLLKSKVLEVPHQVRKKYGFIILWAAVGLDLVISVLGYPVIGQAVSALFVIVYLADHISIRRALCSFWFAVIDVFFREISVGGDSKLLHLKDGRAVIFVCAPHVNQFIDPIVVMKTVAETTGRHVSWMVADISYKRKVIGFFAKVLRGIPVARPADYETAGAGFITAERSAVRGHGGTRFTQQLEKGSVIIVKKDGVKASGKVGRVIDDENLVLTAPLSYKIECMTSLVQLVSAMGYSFPNWWPAVWMVCLQIACLVTHLLYAWIRDGVMHSAMVGEYFRDYHKAVHLSKPDDTKGEEQAGLLEKEGEVTRELNISDPTAFTFLPYVDQSEMFNQVHEHLQKGGTIGIFPEGGTHDGTNLLPLKWGVSTMVLGALAKYEGKQPLKISIIPVGLNYFAPHKFRSTVSVDFGDAIEISETLVEKYKNGSKEDKQEANREVMELVMLGVRSCTLLAKDVETLHLFRTLRRIYVPQGTRLSVADNVALTQGFAVGFDRVKNDPRVEALMRGASEYRKMLLEYRVRDHQVQRFQGRLFSPQQARVLRWTILMRVLTLVSLALPIFPWILSLAPCGLIGRVVSDIQARKVKKMSVIGTWKVLMASAFVPLIHVIYTACCWSSFGRVAGLLWFFFAPLAFVFMIFASEDEIRIFQSLNALLLIFRNKDIGNELYHRRTQLRKELLALQQEQRWLSGIDSSLKQTLERRQSASNDFFTIDDKKEEDA
ncbi:hypothetical protein GUITHDRAFT_139343 [Guillardia theta CCMP2712]|uniref:Phospholipid/glycerol acyltransferase domain-containing protein n=1 Tax=Guillardia theta (strain CCMP2712) TaxID=905079 RepID=L1J940_GUITC|nr:hypothetical protein GUITHDRAFT_139343 [Guillardia theta CCMP2712]EKX45073.1 hypothetical protein GUITHDRAFT_139343 [Guillardia theta CCMP2712]|eukprot:XP_005832053.1 hypothetical protein GUITHDRAFT_139343 [Guillardia theta CCMP2712]